MKNDKTDYYYVIYDSETVVFNQYDIRVMAFPTEDEALEFLEDNDID